MCSSRFIYYSGVRAGGGLPGSLGFLVLAQAVTISKRKAIHGIQQIAGHLRHLFRRGRQFRRPGGCLLHEINSAVEEQSSGAQAVVKAMERMRELVQQTTSGSTELAASAEQMSKMSRELLDSMNRFALADRNSLRQNEEAKAARQAAAGAHA